MTKMATKSELITPDPVAQTFGIPVSSVICENCINSSLYSELDDTLWCHGWSLEVNRTDFCSFFRPIQINTEKET